ncbi:MAG: 16S rRNA (guanine(527)-N(7))-methyltransferase RsmG [Atopobiaceae bacterium]|jgi:16S rRNA (guanine527-N7)-methyltransferase
MPDQRIEHLQSSASDAGITLTNTQCELLLKHLSLVIEKNKVVNLTRIVDEEEAIYLHILDSLLLIPSLAEAPQGRFLDIGTGAGFPGIPLSIVSGRKGVLVDSVGKKINAVQEFIHELHLDKMISARHVRVEDLALKEKGSYAAVVARAVAQINILIEYATPLLSGGGKLIITKSHPSKEELDAGSAAAEICGLKFESQDTFELPQGLGHREILVYKRVGSPTIKLPRKPGTALRQPLGV